MPAHLPSTQLCAETLMCSLIFPFSGEKPQCRICMRELQLFQMGSTDVVHIVGMGLGTAVLT